ncbi:ABC transporter permease [Actinophytocola oryzae]|uniref:Ribose transport system permease protein n=1 Tax=Actinophytocola oryzae TaxID=502181 RepID=A0A4R7VW12_9PSEU|nr:ABC transporter permease [Actinophytocola oryzae]TDV53835.1 ribose transport system permease protein [Actinophytocola oryzae]
MPSNSALPRNLAGRLLLVDELGVIAALVALVGVVGAFHPAFLDPAQLVDVVEQAAFVGILACGMTYLLAMRELDLSVGSTYALSIVGAAILIQNGLNPWLGAAGGVVIGAVLGTVNGIVGEAVRIPSIITTLGTLSLYRGLALAISDGKNVADLPRTHDFFTVVGGDLLGVPVPVWVLVLVALTLTVVLRRTRFGTTVRAIGSNPEAARFSGISLPRTRIKVLALSGALAGLSGMLTLAFFASGDPTIGGGYELQAIAAAIIGGTPLRGGSGTVWGSVLGAVILGTVASGLVYFGVPINWNLFATGVVILLAVAMDSLLRRRRAATGFL